MEQLFVLIFCTNLELINKDSFIGPTGSKGDIGYQ